MGGAPKVTLGVAAPDSHTVRITLKHRSATLPRCAGAARRHAGALRGAAANVTERDSLASNGAFNPVPTEDGLTLAKNPHFFGQRDVKVPAVNFVVAASSDEAYDMVRARTAQLTWGFSFMPPPRSARFTKAEGGSDLLFVAVNAHRPLLAQREVRHALAMTIDREVS